MSGPIEEGQIVEGGLAHAVVVTGLSGAGKTTALNALADVGFYCVDNLPPTLAAATVRTCGAAGFERVALGMDVRAGSFLATLEEAIEALRHHPGGLSVLYLDAADEVLVRRFSETRRPHPIAASLPRERRPSSLLDAVRLERERLGVIRLRATLELDTSHLSTHQLRRAVIDHFSDGDLAMELKVVSFGFKHGLPLDANLVFDVRFLDNPYFVPGLREKTGDDPDVRDYVLASDGAAELLTHISSLLSWSIPRYRREGKSYLTVAIGCTGGRHRSVVLANELGRSLSEDSENRVAIMHRDAQRGAIMAAVSMAPKSDGGVRGEDE